MQPSPTTRKFTSHFSCAAQSLLTSSASNICPRRAPCARRAAARGCWQRALLWVCTTRSPQQLKRVCVYARARVAVKKFNFKKIFFSFSCTFSAVFMLCTSAAAQTRPGPRRPPTPPTSQRGLFVFISKRMKAAIRDQDQVQLLGHKDPPCVCLLTRLFFKKRRENKGGPINFVSFFPFLSQSGSLVWA